MILKMIFCSYWATLKWLQNHLITCPLKKITGIDCPGCGFQRSVIALLKGDMTNSLHLYPATIPILVLSVFCIADSRYSYSKKYPIKKCLYLLTGFVITASYLIKITGYN